MIEMNRLKVRLLFIIISFIGVTGCNKEVKPIPKDYDKNNIESEKQEAKNKKTDYDNVSNAEELEELKLSDDIEKLNYPYCIRMTLSTIYDMKSLNSKGIGQMIRRSRGKYYSVTHIENDKYLFLLYMGTTEKHNRLVDGFLVSKLADEKFLKGISKGMKQEEILEKDPSAFIWLDGEKSYHRFLNGDILEVTYTLKKNQHIVSEVQFLEDQISVLDYLLPQDLEKILPESLFKKAKIKTNILLDEKEWDTIKYDNNCEIEEYKERKLSSKIKRLNFPHCIGIEHFSIYDIEILKTNGFIDIVRYHNGRYYSITRIKKNKYLFLLYDGTEVGTDYLIDGFLVSKLADEKFLKDISKGMKQKEILEKDPSAFIWLDGEKSYHRFLNGDILEVTYTLKKNQYIVSKVQFLEDQVSVLDYLLPQDLEKILPNSN